MVRSALVFCALALVACDPDGTLFPEDDGAGGSAATGGSTSSGSPMTFPRRYEGPSNALTSRAITWGDMSLVECPTTDNWLAVLDENGEIVISAQLSTIASSDANTTFCEDLIDVVIMRGTHDFMGAFDIDYMYESTIEPIQGIFGDRLMGGYDAEFTGVLPGFGFGELTKEERVTWDLPLVTNP